MGHLLSALLSRPGLSMSKGAVARVAWQPGAPREGQLVWVVTPRRLEPMPSLDAL
jgi:hypothetical protein